MCKHGAMSTSGEVSYSWPAIHAVRMTRHLLAGPSGEAGAVDIAAAVGGLQAQVDGVPPLSVLARDRTSAPARVRNGALWSALVRMWTLRGTIHLVPEADAHWYAAALGDSVAARETRLWPRQGVPADAEDQVNDALIAALAGGPLERRVLAGRVGAHLGDAYRVLLEHPWGIGLKPAVARGLVRLDGSGPRLRLYLPDQRARERIGQVDKNEAQRWLATRYLTANVAGTTASFATWSGLPRKEAGVALDDVAESRIVVDGQWYASIGSMAPSATGTDIALLPAFDPYLLAVADKDGFCGSTVPRIYRAGGWVSATIVRGGLPVGTWTVTGARTAVGARTVTEARMAVGAPTKRVECEFFEKPDAATTHAVAAEADRVESFLAATSD